MSASAALVCFPLFFFGEELFVDRRGDAPALVLLAHGGEDVGDADA